MLWIPHHARDETEGTRLLRRAARLALGLFGSVRSDEGLTLLEGGSGVLTHPFSGLTAKHVARYLITKLDGREKLPRGTFRTYHSATLFQHLNPFEEKVEGALWHVTRGWDSPLTDLSLFQVTAGDGPTHQPTGYFDWELLPPPTGDRVYLIGFPAFALSDHGNEFGIESRLTFVPAKVTGYHPRGRRAFKFPCFSVDVTVASGFSGGAVIHNGSLCGLVAAGADFEDSTLCAALWPLSILEYDSELPNMKTTFSTLFDRGVIRARDWDQVKGRVERRLDDDERAYAFLADGG